ncbi:MAG: hypothetical protein ACOC5D_04700 [Thermoplasmatota archaeon]
MSNENLETIDDHFLVKIYNEAFIQGYQQRYKERGMINKRNFRFQENHPARIYNRLRHIRQIVETIIVPLIDLLHRNYWNG